MKMRTLFAFLKNKFVMVNVNESKSSNDMMTSMYPPSTHGQSRPFHTPVTFPSIILKPMQRILSFHL